MAEPSPPPQEQDAAETVKESGMTDIEKVVVEVKETGGAESEGKDLPEKNDSYLQTKKQEFVLSFEDLTCYVPGIPRHCCVSQDNPITNWIEYYMGVQVQERDPFYSLDRCSGYVKSGEMCLVLGSNEQSKSTLLRALCDRLNTQDELLWDSFVEWNATGTCQSGMETLVPICVS